MKQKALESMALRYYRQLKILGYLCDVSLVNTFPDHERNVPEITIFGGNMEFYSFDKMNIGQTIEKLDKLVRRGLEGMTQ